MEASYTLDASGAGDGPSLPVPWWSFSKTVIAVACFRAAETGLLDLDRPVEPVGYTMRQLLRHTAGLADYGLWRDYHEAVAARGEPWPLAAVVERGLREARPGGDWNYSNIGYAIAATLLAEATGRPLGELVSSYVFAPAG